MKNKERIEQLENRIEALENHFAKTNKTIEPLVFDKNGNGIVMHSDGVCTVYPDMDISRSYTTLSPSVEPNLITDWLSKHGKPEIEAKVTHDLLGDSDVRELTTQLNEAKGQVAELRATFNERLSDATRNTVEALVEAHKRINELEAEKANQIYVPVALDGDGDLKTNLYSYCKLNGIDQTKIKRITLTMREE
jgi:hypothetical protein